MSSQNEKKAQIAAMMENAEVLLSPMAGVTDLVFRDICRRHGADVTYCEFVSADGVLHGNEATVDLMLLDEDEPNVGIQLFGSDPGRMAEAARSCAKLGPTLIDINFGCPVKKVVKKNGGSALLCNVPLMEEIVKAVVAAVDLPVTAKTRTGWSPGTLNHLETTQMLEEAGACAITLHGRTREQKFMGQADWSKIAEAKAQATVPIIGNGDVCNASDWQRMKDETKCDAVMIARAAIGNPWIFEEIAAHRAGREWTTPSLDRVVATLIDHLDREIALKGPRVGMNRMKRHFSSYLKGFPGVSTVRQKAFSLNDRDAVVEIFESYRREYRDSVAA